VLEYKPKKLGSRIVTAIDKFSDTIYNVHGFPDFSVQTVDTRPISVLLCGMRMNEAI